MDHMEIRAALNHKLNAAWEAYLDRIVSYPPERIFAHAEEITATKLVYNELRNGGYYPSYLEYLLRFEDPLAVVRDQWMEESNVAHDEEMNHVLWNLVDKGHAEESYTLDPEYIEQYPEPEQEMQ